jgi:hypothetical protein
MNGSATPIAVAPLLINGVGQLQRVLSRGVGGRGFAWVAACCCCVSWGRDGFGWMGSDSTLDSRCGWDWDAAWWMRWPTGILRQCHAHARAGPPAHPRTTTAHFRRFEAASGCGSLRRRLPSVQNSHGLRSVELWSCGTVELWNCGPAQFIWPQWGLQARAQSLHISGHYGLVNLRSTVRDARLLATIPLSSPTADLHVPQFVGLVESQADMRRSCRAANQREV